ncbi:MAG: hypothetical protein K2M20_11100, partial [Lachnospiraceae bacterium]|nr:hypothetical protein [Lachnospiraceae bacterium]
ASAQSAVTAGNGGSVTNGGGTNDGESGGGDSGGGQNKNEAAKNFSDLLYDEITAVIGGDNPNQFFCMSLPGTLIDPSQYAYDVKNNEPKPAHVKANESKLVNKLFDACFMTASDNGRHLQTQYRTALNMLTPKMNGKLFEAKTKLREVLMTPYPYNFGDGDTSVLTLEQVFYRLYGEYVETKQKWAQKQLDKRNELKKKYPGETTQSYVRQEDEFLDWYGVVAEGEELLVQEKLGMVLNVFSPGDMEIINGILDSGTGRELTEARTTLDNVEEINPDGGYVYPVTLYPQDWFDLLDTSFQPVDLLESPAALSQQLKVLEMQRSNITANLNQFLQVIPKDAEVDKLKSAYDACEGKYKEALTGLIDNQINATMDMVKTVVDIIASKSIPEGGSVKDVISESTVARVFGIEVGQVKNVINCLDKSAKECIEKQNSLVTAAENAVKSGMSYFEKNNQLQLKTMLQPLQQQLGEVNDQISQLKQKISLSAAMNPDEPKKDGKATVADKSSVAPNQVPDRFTQIIIDTKLSSVSQQSSRESEASESSCGVSFFFGGYSSNKSHQSSVGTMMNDRNDVEIQIGMSVAKVQIEREWFNPGVFLLTADMYNTSSERISPASTTSFSDQDTKKVRDRFKQMNECVFPCYPAAFVVAKDVTIRFVSQSAIASSFAQSVEDHSSKGGGFFIFGGSSAQASSSSGSSSSATSTSNSVTVRFTSPQILGYYLEAVPADHSMSISSSDAANDTDFISVFEFIATFKKMLDDHNEKYNKQLMGE